MFISTPLLMRLSTHDDDAGSGAAGAAHTRQSADSQTPAPVQLCCPITTELFIDPVVAVDGHTYSRAPIEMWLKRSKLSPMTGNELSSLALTSNTWAGAAVSIWCTIQSAK